MDKNILDYTEEEFQQLVAKIVKKGSAVLHDQKLTRQELAQACARMGEVEELDYFMNPKDSPQISIVSGAIVDGKAIGMFGPTELEWHANGTGRYNFKEICVGLYCETECVDTVLSLVNQCDAFQELSEEEKNYYRNIDINLNNSKGVAEPIWRDDGVYITSSMQNKRIIARLDIKGSDLVKGIHLEGLRVLGDPNFFAQEYYKDGAEIENFDDFKDKLYSIITRSKYMFHHVFRKGDLLFMDQLTTSHRRSAIKNKERQLWRTAFDYSKAVIDYTPVVFE